MFFPYCDFRWAKRPVDYFFKPDRTDCHLEAAIAEYLQGKFRAACFTSQFGVFATLPGYPRSETYLVRAKGFLGKYRLTKINI
jgi:hypothetical protein